MASMFKYLMLFLTLMATFVSSTESLSCSSQKFTNRSFTHCHDLPTLNASLHWTHAPKNSSLSVAYLAAPPKPRGWVAWAVNPSAPAMVGAQAFLASLTTTGAPTLRTFNLSSYAGIHHANLSFPVWDLAADFSDGRFIIFATFTVPPNATSLNHIWQAGPAVDAITGAPAVHDFKPANLESKGVLTFDGARSPPRAHGGASPPAPASTGTTSPARGAADNNSGVARITRRDLGSFLGLFAFILGFGCF